jgi:hypothetical protein
MLFKYTQYCKQYDMYCLNTNNIVNNIVYIVTISNNIGTMITMTNNAMYVQIFIVLC